MFDQTFSGQNHHPRLDSEQLADLKMLDGLGHDRLVCRYNEQDEMDPADTGQHVLDESFMTGDIDEAQAIRP